MDFKDCFWLGRTIKENGLQGALSAYFDVDNIEPYFRLKYVYIDLNNQLSLFRIHDLRHQGAFRFILFFDQIQDRLTASRLAQKDLYLPLSFLPPLKDGEFYYHEVIGFEMCDRRYGKIGVIAEVRKMPAQDLFCVSCEGMEILIPIVDEFDVYVDRSARTVLISTPPGLIEVYTHKDYDG